jgi:hypothetical protein
MHFYSSLSSILSVLGTGTQPFETAICEVSVRSESVLDERSANRKLSGFDGWISPVNSASLQRLIGHY